MTDEDKQQCTMMLVITADGHTLPPLAIFRRKTHPKTNFHQELL
jgi:hypothetical protein